MITLNTNFSWMTRDPVKHLRWSFFAKIVNSVKLSYNGVRQFRNWSNHPQFYSKEKLRPIFVNGTLKYLKTVMKNSQWQKIFWRSLRCLSQPAFSCSKSTMETPKQFVKLGVISDFKLRLAHCLNDGGSNNKIFYLGQR